jgi:hypothetical protein
MYDSCMTFPILKKLYRLLASRFIIIEVAEFHLTVNLIDVGNLKCHRNIEYPFKKSDVQKKHLAGIDLRTSRASCINY